jgi:3-hydroxyacyl-[acyl-carrier-protein] dehydratase
VIRAIDGLEVHRGPELTFRAWKRVSAADPYLCGHFPEVTIYPGVFTLESVQQAVAAAIGAPARITVLRSARFLVPLLERDVLTAEGTIAAAGPDGGFEVDARCVRGDGVLAATVRARFGGEVPDAP